MPSSAAAAKSSHSSTSGEKKQRPHTSRRKVVTRKKVKKFRARPAPKTNVESSFSALKKIVDMPVAANLAQVQSGYRASIIDDSGSNIGRVVVQADSKLDTVRKLIKMFLSNDIVAFSFVDKEGNTVGRKAEQDVVAYQVLHAPTEAGTLPVLQIRYSERSRRPEQRYS